MFANFLNFNLHCFSARPLTPRAGSAMSPGRKEAANKTLSERARIAWRFECDSVRPSISFAGKN
jgi:hypothetical protein